MLRCDAVAALPGEAVSVADSPSDTSMLDETVPPGDAGELAAQLDEDSLDATLPPPSPLAAVAVEQDSMESSDSVVLLNKTMFPAARFDTGKSAFSDDLFESEENSAPVDGATFLDVTAPPVDEGSRETSPEIVVVLERVQPEGQDRGAENRIPEELRRTDVGRVKTSKNPHPNDAKARKKVPLHSRSPLAPTQPPAAPRWLSKTKSSCHTGTLDSWLQPNKPPTSDPHIGPRGKASIGSVPQVKASNTIPQVSIPGIAPAAHQKVPPKAARPRKGRLQTGTKNAVKSQLLDNFLQKFAKSPYNSPNLSAYESQTLPDSQDTETVTISSQSSLSSCPDSISEEGQKTPELQDSPVAQGSDSAISDEHSSNSSHGSFVLPVSSPLSELRSLKRTKQTPLSPGPTSFTEALNRSSVVTICRSPCKHNRSLVKALSASALLHSDRKPEDSETNNSSPNGDQGTGRKTKEERRMLLGYDCKCCASYYDALGLNDEERMQRVDQVSKHRAAVPISGTPEHYWEIGMSDREEQRRRGQITESSSPISLKTRNPQYETMTKKPVRRRLFS